MCTTVLKEVCSYYVSRGSDVYICLLDASKAFDRVHYGKLFDLLKSRNIPVLVRRLLLDMYTRQKLETVWNGKHSESFCAANGVKQGGILSPLLFCVYFDELLLKINQSGLGCHVGHLSYAGIGYADDVTTAAPSMTALQSIICLCAEFGRECDVLWNWTKSKCIKIGGNGVAPRRNIILNGKALKWKNKVEHLGHKLRYDLSDYDDIMSKKGSFISQVNKLNVQFKTVPSLLKGKLLQTYCASWYGCQIWDLDSNMVQAMQTEWNKAVRRTLKIPYQTHRNLLPLIVKSRTFEDQHFKRVSKFVNSIVESENEHLAFIGERAKSYSHGSLGRNYRRCMDKTVNDRQNPELLSIAQSICELLEVRDGQRVIPGLSRLDVHEMIEYLCCC